MGGLTVPILLDVRTEGWQLQVSGEIPPIPSFIALAPTTAIEQEGTGVLGAFNRASGNLEPVEPGQPVEPIFFENVPYDFYLLSASDDTELRLPGAPAPRNRVGGLAHYSLNFRNNVGFVEVEVVSPSGGSRLRLEVFPTKIDYRSDYVNMRDEVAGVVRNLVLTAQARTFNFASPAPAARPTLPEWLSLLRYQFAAFRAAARAIAQNPHSKLSEFTHSTPVERSKRVNERALLRELRRPVTRSGGSLPQTGIAIPSRVPERVKRVSFDTPENRYVKGTLLATRAKLQRLLNPAIGADDDADPSAEAQFFRTARPLVEEMLREVQRLLAASYLQDVAGNTVAPPASTVLHYHPQYAAFSKAARILNGGISVGGGPLTTGLKDIARLYEYWCFLRLVAVLREKLDLEQQSIVRVSHLGTTVVLQKGQEAAVQFRDRASGKRVFLLYNRKFWRVPTISQQPDNVIQLASEDRLCVLDAKYRLAHDSDYRKRYGGVGPTVDDINTMHRYRDAIVVPDGSRPGEYRLGVVKRAVVLFPFPDEQGYEGHRFWRSIGTVGIGGLPFLPQATTQVESFLRGLLRENGFLNEPSED